MNTHRPTRRTFMKTSLLGLYAAGHTGHGWAQADTAVPTRGFGKTDEQVSILGVGGHHLGRLKSEQEAVAMVRRAIDLGVTFMDNAWEYHGGKSEEWMGAALQDGYRDKAFLMTKHHGRKSKATAMQHLEDSLRRLKTDVIDLWQFHEVVYEDDANLIFSSGAIEAANEAKRQGKVRYVGFTGHKDPNYHLEMLAYGYDWDAVQMPINPMDAHFKSFEKEVLPVLLQRGIAPIGMKSTGSGHLLRSGAVTAAECIRYALSQPISTLVAGFDSIDMLEENAAIARDLEPLSESATEEILAKVKEPALTGKYEPFKTTRMFDGRVGREVHGIA